MKYSIDINGIHCMGCKSIITIVLEEKGFENVEFNDLQAYFQTDFDKSSIEEKLNAAFKELTKYSYSNLKVI